MNTRLLRKVQKAIMKEPRRLNMSYFGREVDHNMHPEIYPPCNTQGCIAGHVLWITHPRVFLRAIAKDDYIISDRARQDLQLTTEQSNRLFYFKSWGVVEDGQGNLLGWSEKFEDRYNMAATPLGRAKVVVDRIEHFIKTKGRE